MSANFRQMEALAISIALRSERKLRDFFPTCTLIFKAVHEKQLADGVIQGVKEASTSEVLSYYCPEENVDIYILCGPAAVTRLAAELLQQAYGKKGRVHTVSQFFKDKIKKPRPISATFPLNSSNAEDNSMYVVGSLEMYPNHSINHQHSGRFGAVIPKSSSASSSNTTNKNRLSLQNDFNGSDLASTMHGLTIGSLSSNGGSYNSNGGGNVNRRFPQNRNNGRNCGNEKLMNNKTSNKINRQSCPVLESLPMTHLINNGPEGGPKRRGYSIFDLLGRYRSRTSKSYPQDWEYLVAIYPDIFSYDFMQERINQYLNYWGIEEY